MVEAWWLVIAAGGGVGVGMFLFAVMSMARDDSHDELETVQ